MIRFGCAICPELSKHWKETEKKERALDLLLNIFDERSHSWACRFLIHSVTSVNGYSIIANSTGQGRHGADLYVHIVLF